MASNPRAWHAEVRISEEYRRLNRQLHESRPDYGSGGHTWAGHIRHLAHAMNASSVLDYGSGKGTLDIPEPVRRYDPCIPGLDAEPEPADLVVCTDVLEHVEPDCLDDVLDHMRALTQRGVFLVVATAPAKKSLPDGRNAHLLQRPVEWWLPKLMTRWKLGQVVNQADQFIFIGRGPLA